MLLCLLQSALQSLLLAEPHPTADVLAAALATQPVASQAYKHALELSFRTTLHTLCQQSSVAGSSPLLSPLLELSFACTPQLLDATLPFQLLEDAFDYTPLMHLPPLFGFLSSHSSSLASPALTQPRPRLALLKACNGLLRRLSKTEGAAWSGELLELLSRMMTVDERGGLNATGKFHSDNHTPIHSEPAAAAADDAESAVDHAFYRTLWSLQSYFADPPKLKQDDSLSSFLSSLDSVLTAFERSATAAIAMSSAQSTAAYFPKYLSGPRLLHLQLQDSTFRRHLLTQSLIAFQYLLNPAADPVLVLPSLAAPAATGSARPTTAGTGATTPAAGGVSGLSASQTSAVKGALVRVLQLLAVTVGDDGRPVDSSADKYGEHLLHLLRDELAWMRWKHAKAPTFTRAPTSLAAPLVLSAPPAKRSKRGKAPAGVLLMGSAVLSALWSEVSPNEEAVRDGARSFAPELEVKLQELLDEDDQWQRRLQRWKRRQAMKKEKEESKEEEKGSADRMDEDGADDEDDTEPDESELLRKNKQRQWTMLRLLRRADFPLFQKSDGKLDKVVDEMKRRRQQATDKAARDREQSERTKAEEEAKEATKETAEAADAVVAGAAEEDGGGSRAEEGKEGDAEKMEGGSDEMAQADEAAIELERKTDPGDEAGGKAAQDTEERAEREPDEDEEEDEREEARSSRRAEARGGDDSPRAAGKRRGDTAGSDDDSGESGKRQKVDDETDAQQQAGDEQADRAAAISDAETAASEAATRGSAAAADDNPADDEPVAAPSHGTGPSVGSEHSVSDDTEMQTAE